MDQKKGKGELIDSRSVIDPPSGNSAGEFRRAVVTGGTGFIGGHLVSKLQTAGLEVRCLCRANSNTEPLREQGVDCRVVDWMDARSVADGIGDADLVFHLAATTATWNTREFYQTNTTITAHVAQACALRTSPPVLLICSSIAAAGPVPRGETRLPDTPAAPISHYGKSKRGGELAAVLLADQVPLTIVRPGIVFGPNDRHLLPAFETIDKLRLHFVPGFRSPQLSWIHVDDVVEILWRAAVRGTRASTIVPAEADVRDEDMLSGFYFATCPEHVDFREIGRLIGMGLDRRFVTLHIPQPLPWLLGAGVEVFSRLQGRTPALQVDKMREASAPSWACRDDRLASELEFTFPADLQTRIRQTAQWYREAGWLRA